MNKDLIIGSLLSMRHQINDLISHVNGLEVADITSHEHKITKIAKAISGYYSVSYADLIAGPRLKEPASSAKHVAIYFCVQEGFNTHEIKTFFNLSAYQSIYYACDKVADVLAGKQPASKLNIQHIKAIDIQTLAQYINEKLK